MSRTKVSNSFSYEDLFAEQRACFTVIHLAGQASDLKKTSSDSDYDEINFEFTKRVFD
ncbi:MAG: nucleoside-diphosphate-sugar epimerase [Flavobacteriales bacterium]|jgi:nucleoside-diphosphate-sugar epimerase